uniref:basic proline-rich protein-like n=1 Tax=Nyctereutes procyonoides TaxID=34880 RepID=UPI0024437677|nr:basic proline-rich protein-like [Nyctereutes procyonoides]
MLFGVRASGYRVMYSKPRPQKDSRRAESAGVFGPPPPPPPPPPPARGGSEPGAEPAGLPCALRRGSAFPPRARPAPPAPPPRRPRPPARPAQARARRVEGEERSAERNQAPRRPASTPSARAAPRASPPGRPTSPRPPPGLRQPRYKVAHLRTGTVRIPPAPAPVPPSPPAEVPAVTTGAAWLRGTTRDEPLAGRRLPQPREILASAEGKSGEGRGGGRSLACVLPAPAPPLPRGPRGPAIHPNFEGLPSFLPPQRRPSRVGSGAPPRPPYPRRAWARERSEHLPPQPESPRRLRGGKLSQGGMLQTVQQSCHICPLPARDRRAAGAGAHTLLLRMPGTGAPGRSSPRPRAPVDPPPRPSIPLHPAPSRSIPGPAPRARPPETRAHTPPERSGGSRVCARPCAAGPREEKLRAAHLPPAPPPPAPAPYLGPGPRSAPVPSALQPAPGVPSARPAPPGLPAPTGPARRRTGSPDSPLRWVGCGREEAPARTRRFVLGAGGRHPGVLAAAARGRAPSSAPQLAPAQRQLALAHLQLSTQLSIQLSIPARPSLSPSSPQLIPSSPSSPQFALARPSSSPARPSSSPAHPPAHPQLIPQLAPAHPQLAPVHPQFIPTSPQFSPSLPQFSPFCPSSPQLIPSSPQFILSSPQFIPSSPQFIPSPPPVHPQLAPSSSSARPQFIPSSLQFIPSSPPAHPQLIPPIRPGPPAARATRQGSGVLSPPFGGRARAGSEGRDSGGSGRRWGRAPRLRE